MVRRCLRVRVVGFHDGDSVPAGTRLAAGTLVALGVNGGVRCCYSTNTFEFECVDDHVSPMELDLPQTWIAGSGVKI